MAKHNIEFWRGTRSEYNELVIAGKANSYTHYSVKEGDGTWSSFFGVARSVIRPGQVEPVERLITGENVFSTLYADAKPQTRYLVEDNGNYFIVEMGPFEEGGVKNVAEFYPLGDKSVRIKNGDVDGKACKSKEYQLLAGDDGKMHLITYDDTDCGLY